MTVLANGRCSVGNCYSLRKDYKSVLKMFQSAIQLNEISRYAHMLSGHEPVYSSSRMGKDGTSWKLK
ncbi:unnamed protein product, partial [Brassica oleracea var. botrytis]